MNTLINRLKTEVYNKCAFEISEFYADNESKSYYACDFKLNELHIKSRKAKITPKKVGQFVTFWKRNAYDLIIPFEEHDQIDFFVINVEFEDNFGQFVFPKSLLIKKGIISTEAQEGKRGFRVYPEWDAPQSKQAQDTQKWQLEYFFEINDATNLKLVNNLYGRK